MDGSPGRPSDDTELTLLTREELEALVQSRSETLGRVMDAMPDLLVQLDSGGRIEMTNEAVRSRLGYDPEAVVGRPIDALLASPDRTDDDRFTDTPIESLLMRERRLTDVEVAFSTVDGAVVPMSLSTSVLGDDRVEGFVCVATDISDRIRRERTLELQNEQLELLNRIVRHDIRNDVNLVLELVRRLQPADPDSSGDVTLTDRERAFLYQIEDSGTRIVEFTETARDLTQAIEELGEDRTPVSLATTLRREVAKASTISADATVQALGDVPEVSVLANEMLSSVFRNLLSNAIKHNDKDTPAVTVSVDVDDVEGTVTVGIADNGPGIPDDAKAAVFEDGWTSAEGDGTGFGLHIVETLVEQYGGTIRVADNEPTGTVFELTLEQATDVGQVRRSR